MTPEEVIAMSLQAAESECLSEGSIPGYSLWAAKAVAALRVAGYELVKLPENRGDWHVNDVGTVGVYEAGFGVRHKGVAIRDVGYDLVASVAEGREFAAALLAAAVAAEETP